MNEAMAAFDYTLQGKRIKLIRTNDRYTKLKPNDMGTIKYIFDNLSDRCIDIKWDGGSTLSLIEGVDQYEIVE
jgi:hypothetical protein